MTHTVRHRLEYGLVRFLTLPLRYLPYRCALSIACGFAAVAFAVMPRRRATAIERIREVLGENISIREAQRIAWISWRNIVFNLVDLVRFPSITEAWLQRVMNLDDAEQALASVRTTGKGAVLALPHTGSWELAAAGAVLRGMCLFSIAADQRNRLLTDYINTLRMSHGMALLSRGRANLRDIVRRLKTGDLFAILPDLRQRTEGLHVSFLGGEANVGAGMATFARIAGVPILPCYMTREGWSHHRFHVLTPVIPDPERNKIEDIQRMTQEVLTQVDAVIRAQPDQWFWHNRRWVLEPLETNH
ncbi:MAG: lysophospholipid acyltransferase family protein [Kiritimatiellae bacterium]|nr:lysophospholipid acyltransferase family protein [Kiritimatiellia bacterium]